jgi:hypothetical protein
MINKLDIFAIILLFVGGLCIGMGIGSCANNTPDIISQPPTTVIVGPDGKTHSVAEGHTLEIEVVQAPGVAGTTYQHAEGSQTALGSGVDASGVGAVPKIAMPSQPKIGRDGQITTGAVETAWEVVKQGGGVLIVAGIVCIIIAGIAFYFTKSFMVLLIGVGIGVLLVVLSVLVNVLEANAWVLIVTFLALAGTVGYIGYRSWAAARNEKTLTALVQGINEAEIADEESASVVLEKIAKYNEKLGGIVRKVVDKIKINTKIK